jgi:hypothetical protein
MSAMEPRTITLHGRPVLVIAENQPARFDSKQWRDRLRIVGSEP